MIRYMLILLVFFSACKTSEHKIVWELQQEESIVHTDIGSKKVQTVYSISNLELFPLQDTTVIVQSFKDTLLVEEIEYRIENGDSIEWRRRVIDYDSKGMPVKKVDFYNGILQSEILSFYVNGKVEREEVLFVFPEHHDAMEVVTYDTTKSILISVYNARDQRIKLLEIRQDKLSSALRGMTEYDTSVTYTQYNEHSWPASSITILEGDTVSLSRTEYDSIGRPISMIHAAPEIGLTASRFEYDERGNTILEDLAADDRIERTVTEYDGLNNPVSRKTFAPQAGTADIVRAMQSQ